MSAEKTASPAASDIAVVGLACRLPGARTADAFWRNLREGVESIRPLTDSELRRNGVPDSSLQAPNYVKAAAVLPGLELFDAGFFGFSAREAAILDPQHRHFLECAWEALEDAAQVPERFRGSIGVFAGCGMNAYFMFNLLTNPDLVRSVGLFLLRHTGNDKDFLTTRVSYCLDLTGPSVGVQTACSTSLVAVHTACQSLLSGECDMALAGGVTIEIPHGHGYFYEEGEILSPDGHCRAFDADSKGTVFGSGAGVVVLRRLADALEDGDRIRAVIKGSAVNNDGASKVGYLAPSVDGQAKAVREALAVSAVPARSIGYIEAHGTGTPVGDPIEIAALAQAFRAETTDAGFCAIGSVKTNIGHLDTAAGVAGLIKVILAMEHGELPPSLNYRRPNPNIDFGATPFVVNDALRCWPAGPTPRRAGVNALGVGGTNAHVIVEEAPPAPPLQPGRSAALLLVSPRSRLALDRACDRLAEHLERHPETDPGDVAYTLQVGRRRFDHRRHVVARAAASAAQLLRQHRPNAGAPVDGAPARATGVVFLFPGGGAQFPGMGAGLYEEEPVFRAEADRCFEWLAAHGRPDVRRLLYPPSGEDSQAAADLERASNSILSVFITELALARLWMSWGVTPVAMTGHSLGEYTAACLSGVLTLEDALTIVQIRADIFDRLPRGAMLSVPLSETSLQPLLSGSLSLAAVNAPELSVASGAVEDIDGLERQLAARGIESHRLHIQVAAHSPMLDPLLDEFAERIRHIKGRPATIPFISNRTGEWADDAAREPTYWVRHLRETVRFVDGLGALAERFRQAAWLEVGPGQTLSALARLHPAAGVPAIVSSMRHARQGTSDLEALYDAAGRLWQAGLELDWENVAGRRRRIALPTYPFDHESYWVRPGPGLSGSMAAAVPAPAPIARIADPDRWYAATEWRAAPLSGLAIGRTRWLVFEDPAGDGPHVAAELARRGHDVITVVPGAGFARLEATTFSIAPGSRADMDALFGALDRTGGVPAQIVHAWLCGAGDAPFSASTVEAATRRGFWTLVALAQAMGAEASGPVDLAVLTRGLERVGDEPVRRPEQATALGPGLVIPNEYPNVACRVIDIAADSVSHTADLGLLVDTLLGRDGDERVALRDGRRFVADITSVPPPAGATESWPRGGETYVITGGTGDLGLEVARRLAASAPVNLVLIGRRSLPPRETWTRPADAATARAIAAIGEIEAAGARVLTAAADVTSATAVAAVIREARAAFGRIHGVLHAAGTLDDAPMQMKDEPAMHRVMAPKIVGVLALEAALADAPADLLVLFSSTSSFLGLPGQVDYTAANAFLNAYARARQGMAARRVMAVEWGVWRDIGIAARSVAASTDAPAEPTGAPVPVGSGVHPLLGAIVERPSGRVVFEATYQGDALWALDEHRLTNGQALLPGTAYVEMARAAAAAVAGDASSVEIRDMYLLVSLEVGDVERRRVRTTLQRIEDGWSWSVTSDAGHGWVEHARGTVHRGPSPDAPVDLGRYADAVRSVAYHRAGRPTEQERHVRFGPRWKNLVEVRYGVDWAMATIELADTYAADLEVWRVHPAILDLAMAAGLPLIPEYEGSGDFYIPWSYERLRIFRPLPRRLFALVTPRGALSPSPESVEFDAVLLDESGQRIVEAQGFLMRRASARDVAVRPRTTRRQMSADAGRDRLALIVQEGIDAEHGWQALRRLAAGEHRPEIIVSSIDVGALRPERPQRDRATPRPASSTRGGAAAAAAGDVEEAIASVWGELLGIDRVGPEDDFFELGGHSLIAVRLIARLEKMFHKKLKLATLFEARTVRDLAAIVGERKQLSNWVSLVPIQTKGDKPPFFCVHGVGGEVLSYSSLASHFAPDQPFIGLRARGHDGGDAPIETIEAQAAFYLSEVRAYQPEGPYYIGGYSHGGRVALEMALQLEAAGQQVAFLGILDTWPYDFRDPWYVYAPRWVGNVPVWLWYELRESSLQDNLDRLRRGVSLVGRRLRSQPDAAHDVSDVVTLDGLPEHVQRLFQTNFDAFRRYRPARPCACRVTLFRATGQPLMSVHGADLGWSRATTGGVDVRPVPGNHTSLLHEPRVRRLAAALRAALDDARRRLTSLRPPAAR